MMLIISIESTYGYVPWLYKTTCDACGRRNAIRIFGCNRPCNNKHMVQEGWKLVTYKSGNCKSVLDYILIRMAVRSLMRNVTVIQGEPSLQHHTLIVCTLEVKKCVRKTRELF